MASDRQNGQRAGKAQDKDKRHAHGAERNAPPGVDGKDDVSGDNDAGQRAIGEAAQFAGAGNPGAGGNTGGTPDAGGLGLPGGVRNLGTGPAQTDDPGLSGTLRTGGLGTPGKAAAGHSEAHPAVTPDSPPVGPVQGKEYPQSPHRPSDHDHKGHLPLAGGSGGSGRGGADLLGDDPLASAQKDNADADRPATP